MSFDLLKAIRARTEKQTEYWHGISTADRYVRTLQDAVGLDACYKHGSTSSASFSDAMHKAKDTLVYANEDMRVEQKSDDFAGIDLPKNTLIAFKHVLTTPRKDRDGDILRTEGAIPDPKMLLLWQHVHTMPIGKMLRITEHSSKRLTMVSAIVDMNSVSHDAAVMIDNGMGRFSHGFRALELSELKESEGDTTGGFAGFDITKFEIMEASVVSVPANPDAEVEEVVLGLVEGGKLTSDMMKTYGATIRDKRPTNVAVEYKATIGDYTHEIKAPNAGVFEQIFAVVKGGDDESGKSKEDGRTDKEDGSTAPKETENGAASKDAERKAETGDTEVTETKTVDDLLSDSTVKSLEDVKTDLGRLDGRLEDSENKQLCKGCMEKIDIVLKGNASGEANFQEIPTKVGVEEIFKAVINDWSPEHQKTLLDVLQVLDNIENLSNDHKLIRALHQKG